MSKYDPRCYYCGRFIPWRSDSEEVVVFEVGTYSLYDPPEVDHAHRECRRKALEKVPEPTP